MTDKDIFDLNEIRRVAGGEGAGTVWTLTEGEDLNANLVCFPDGQGVGEHTNSEVDVLIVGVSGYGVVAVDGEELTLSSGMLILISKGARRWTRSASRDFAYLSIHRRRGPLRIRR